MRRAFTRLKSSPVRLAWAAAALVAAAYLAYAAAGLFTNLTDAGCDELFSECIRVRQQYARGVLGLVAAAVAAAALLAAVRLIAGRPGRWRAVIVVAVVASALFALAQPESHLDHRTEWLSSLRSRSAAFKPRTVADASLIELSGVAPIVSCVMTASSPG